MRLLDALEKRIRLIEKWVEKYQVEQTGETFNILEGNF